MRLLGQELDPPKLIALIALALLTAVVTVAMTRRAGAPVDSPATALSREPIPFREFQLPDEYRQLDDGLHLFRERVSAWSAEQVDEFWAPVEEVVAGVLAEENQRQIEALFADIP